MIFIFFFRRRLLEDFQSPGSVPVGFYNAHAQTEQQDQLLGWTEGDSCTGTVAARSTLRYAAHAQTEQQEQLGWTEGDSCTSPVAARQEHPKIGRMHTLIGSAVFIFSNLRVDLPYSLQVFLTAFSQE
jgi:hypothetical protein